MSSDDQSADCSVNGDDVEVVIVAALDEGRVIGQGGALPWHLPADMRHFKEVTMGHPVIMGRRTYESMGRPLPGRENIVVTRSPGDVEAPGCRVVGGLDQARRHVVDAGHRRAMVIGGQSLYEQLLPIADRMELTVVHGRHDGDTFFPCFDSDEWTVVERRFRPADDDHDRAMTFVTLCAAVDRPRRVDVDAANRQLPRILHTED